MVSQYATSGVLPESGFIVHTITDRFIIKQHLIFYFISVAMSPINHHKTQPYSRPTHYQPVGLAYYCSITALQPQMPGNSPISMGTITVQQIFKMRTEKYDIVFVVNEVVDGV